MRFDEGDFGDVPLAGLRAVVAFEAPQRMIDGNWTEIVLIDESASRDAAARARPILPGEAGGPWAVLGGSSRAASRRDTCHRIRGRRRDQARLDRRLLKTSVSNIRGRDRAQPVIFENIFNQIHGATQVIATGSSHYDDGVIRFETEKSHGLLRGSSGRSPSRTRRRRLRRCGGMWSAWWS